MSRLVCGMTLAAVFAVMTIVTTAQSPVPADVARLLKIGRAHV